MQRGMRMYHYRKLNDTDIHFINELQMQRGYALISEESLPREWVGYGAFTQEGQIVGICFLFLYRRLPHSDYPNGVIAELGACYTVPEYRRQGIMSELIGMSLKNIPADCPQVEAVVADASNHVIRILMEQYGFEDAVAGERRLWKQP